MNKKTLSKISLSISSGLTPLRSNDEYWKSKDIPWVKTEQLGVKNIYDSNEKISLKALNETGLKLNPQNTLSVAMYGEGRTRGSVSILKKEMTTNQACCNIVLDPTKANYEYVYYFLKTQYNQLRNLSSGVRKNLNSNDLKNFEIRIPKDLNTQIQIAKVLSDLDAKIELNNKINSELEAMAKLIYDYWFVQFEFPNEEGKPYKSSGGKLVWNEELKREVPEGWELGNFGTYCKSSGGYAFKSSWWSDNGLKVVKIKDIQEDYTINISDLSSASISGENIDNKFIAKPGNILIAMTGATVGKFGIVPITDGPLYVNQRVGFFNLGTEPIDKLPFLVNSLNQKYFREAIFTLASGAAQPNISNEQINNIQLLIPRKTLLENYNKTLKANYNKILLNQFQNQKLSELRDWLLPMLMNGQVKVDNLSDNDETLNMAAEEREKYR